MKNLKYDSITIQPYLITEYFSLEEKKLLFSLRSQCYDAKLNFRKLYKKDLGCRLKCQSEDSQNHIFQSCQPILDKLGLTEVPNIIHIYGTPVEQKKCNENIYPNWPNEETTYTKFVNMHIISLICY